MLNGQRYSFTERKNDQDQSIIMPYLPITLNLGNRSIEIMALLDSGASVNVLPYEIGRELGAVWENQTLSIPLSGNLAQSESRGLVLTGTVANFSSVLLGFAWSMSNDMSVILGHMNFLNEFHVCFYSDRSEFEVCPKPQK